jgi:hypothetical protein
MELIVFSVPGIVPSNQKLQFKKNRIERVAVILCFIDFTEVSFYASRFRGANLQEHLSLIISAVMAFIAGASTISKIKSKKVTIKFIQGLVASMLILTVIALGSGLI